jgi:hypothetical protein
MSMGVWEYGGVGVWEHERYGGVGVGKWEVEKYLHSHTPTPPHPHTINYVIFR